MASGEDREISQKGEVLLHRAHRKPGAGYYRGYHRGALFRREKTILRRIDLDLEKLRVLLRICHDLRYLDGKGYEFASRQINEAGKMIGGWRKQQEAREP